MLARQKILVTGAAGFLGSWILRAAQAAGAHAVATCRRETDPWRLPGTLRESRLVLDVCDEPGMDEVLARVRPHVVVHCAARGVDPADREDPSILEVNLHGTAALLRAAARQRVSRFVHIGSCFEYASRAGAIDEEGELLPVGPYGASKAAASLLVRERARSLGISALILRPFGLWGPGEGHHRLVPQIVNACRSHQPLALSSCQVTRDYSYVADVATWILALLEIPPPEGCEVINLGSGHALRLCDFVTQVARELNGLEWLRFGKLPDRIGEPESLAADTHRLDRLLGSRESTPLGVGLSRMMTSRWTRRVDAGIDAS